MTIVKERLTAGYAQVRKNVASYSAKSSIYLRVCWSSGGKRVTFSRTGDSGKGSDFARVMVLASREESFADFCVCTCCYWCSWWVAESS